MDKYVILLKDKVGEKSETILKGMLKRMVGRTSTPNVLKGELLEQIPGDAIVPRSDFQKPFNYRLVNDPAVALYCSVYDVAPLSDKEFLLLEAIQSQITRYEVLIAGNKLEWGCGLKLGDPVYVSIPGPTVIPNQRAAAAIRYVGRLPPDQRLMFGIEITDDRYRGHGTTYGSFCGVRYFNCEDNCGLFVALDKLSMDPEGSTLETAPRGSQSYAKAVTHGSDRSYSRDSGPPADNILARSHAFNRTIVHDNQYSQFKIGDRVVAFDKRGSCIHGTVRWTGKNETTRNCTFLVGIQTDVAVSTIEFEGAIPGMNYLFSSPKKHHLFMPEVSVLSEEEATGTSVEPQNKPHPTENIDVESTSILIKEMGITKKQLMATQKHALNRVKAAQELEQHKQTLTGPLRPLQQPPQQVHKLLQQPPQWPQQPLQQPSQQPLHHSQQPLQQPQPPLQQPSQQPLHHSEQPLQQPQPLLQQPSQQPLHHSQQPLQQPQPPLQQPSQQPLHHSQQPLQQPQPPPYQQLPETGIPPSGGSTVTFVPSSTQDQAHRSLSKGSTVQIVAFGEAGPQQPRYGVIHWVGEITGVMGIIAGIELEEPMEGCTDGTFQMTGQKFFDCPDGRGLFYPLVHLKPDERYTDPGTTPGAAGGANHYQSVKSKEKTDAESAQPKKEMAEVEKALQERCTKLETQLSQAQHEKQDLQERHTHLEQQLQKLQKELRDTQQYLQESEQQMRQERQRMREQMQQTQEEKQQLEHRLQEQVADNQELQRQVIDAQTEGQKTRLIQLQGTLEDIECWKIPRSDVQLVKEIGVGAWGSVSEGKYRGQPVAVKQPHRAILTLKVIERLQREVQIMAQVRHPNLVRFIAAVFDDKVQRLHEPPMIVLELLDMNLRAAYEQDVVGASQLPIFRDVAYGLHYLHEHQDPIIHRDVSSPNILLEALPQGAWKAKVSDFGSANLEKHSKTAGEGAIIYSAPETFPHTDLTTLPPPQTTKIDVFSYGILLCEVITKQLPKDSTKYRRMLQQIQRQWLYMYDLILSCTKRDPNERPTMAQVLDKLNKLPRPQFRQRS